MTAENSTYYTVTTKCLTQKQFATNKLWINSLPLFKLGQ